LCFDAAPCGTEFHKNFDLRYLRCHLAFSCLRLDLLDRPMGDVIQIPQAGTRKMKVICSVTSPNFIPSISSTFAGALSFNFFLISSSVTYVKLQSTVAQSQSRVLNLHLQEMRTCESLLTNVMRHHSRAHASQCIQHCDTPQTICISATTCVGDGCCFSIPGQY